LACVVYFFSDNSSAALDKIVEKHYALLDASEKIKSLPTQITGSYVNSTIAIMPLVR